MARLNKKKAYGGSSQEEFYLVTRKRIQIKFLSLK